MDAVIRPQGEIEPEQAAERLPQYVEALRERQLRMPLITTAITSPESPFAETILRTAKKLGIQSYRVGFVQSSEGAAKEKQLTETRAKLKALAALNKEVGIGALVQNHSPSGHEYLGGNLKDLYRLVEGFDPEQIGVAFDIGHALLVHGSEWESHFNRLKTFVRAVYVKDAKPPNRWVPFGQGEVGKSGYFRLLKEMGYHGPISLHMEYEWAHNGPEKKRSDLLEGLRESAGVLRTWLARA